VLASHLCACFVVAKKQKFIRILYSRIAKHFVGKSNCPAVLKFDSYISNAVMVMTQPRTSLPGENPIEELLYSM